MESEARYEVKKYSPNDREMVIHVSHNPPEIPGFNYTGGWVCSLEYNGEVVIESYPMTYLTRHTHQTMGVLFLSRAMRVSHPDLPFFARERQRVEMWVSDQIKEMQYENDPRAGQETPGNR